MQHNFKELKLWQMAMDLAELVYSLVEQTPSNIKWGIGMQLNKSATSIPSNIAEGSGRGSKSQFLYFLNVAQGSAFELETQLLLLNRLIIVNSDSMKKALELTQSIQKMNRKLMESIKVES